MFEDKVMMCKNKIHKMFSENTENTKTLYIKKDKKTNETKIKQNGSLNHSSHKDRRDEERIMCSDILAMELKNSTNNQFTIVIPLNLTNIVSLSLLFVLILFGSYYVWKIFTRKKCQCKICKEEYEMIEKLSEGGFGEVNINLITIDI
jgi:hypothetical protein